MNERIEQLAERATKEMDQEAFSEDMNIPAEWYHKFAELIVKECAHRAEAYAYMSPNFTALSEELRRMIGVEE